MDNKTENSNKEELGKEKIKFYWVSLLIQDTENSRPWLCALTDSCIGIEAAKTALERGRTNFRVLSAWIDTFDENNVKTTVMHECYVNTLGQIDNKI